MLEKIKEMNQTIDTKTILALEIEDDYGRHWITGTKDIIDERLNNLLENEYFSDLDTASKQSDPLCQEFYSYMHDHTRTHNKYGIFDPRYYLPFFLIEKEELTMEQILEWDKEILNSILENKPTIFEYEKKDKGYRFIAKIEDECTIFVELPHLLELSYDINENVDCRINYTLFGKRCGSVPFNIPFSELLQFMKKVIDDNNYRMELID